MRFAARVERRPAARAGRPAFQIVADGKFRAAGPAQNRLLVEAGATPDARAVASLGLMAMEAAIIRSAAFEFDRDDIKSAPIVSAVGTRIDFDAAYRNSGDSDLRDFASQNCAHYPDAYYDMRLSPADDAHAVERHLDSVRAWITRDLQLDKRHS